MPCQLCQQQGSPYPYCDKCKAALEGSKRDQPSERLRCECGKDVRVGIGAEYFTCQSCKDTTCLRCKAKGVPLTHLSNPCGYEGDSFLKQCPICLCEGYPLEFRIGCGHVCMFCFSAGQERCERCTKAGVPA